MLTDGIARANALLALALAFVVALVAWWVMRRALLAERERVAVTNARLDHANEAIRELIHQNVRLALRYVDVNARLHAALEREGVLLDEDDDEADEGRLVS